MPENVPPAHIDVSGMANLVTMMPNKAICDSLFGSFYLMVHPVHSLIHLPTFRTDYNNYWQWCRNSDISMPDNKLLSDPTFLCLMFSVLYCGATASPPELWSTGKLQGLQKEKTVENLRKTFSASLKMCQHLQYPTLATLTSSLLAHSCTESNVGHLEDLGFAHMTVRIAQSMGLHRDGSSFGLDPISCEMRRRVWWHVVWLDVQISMTHGSQVCLGTSESDSNVAMVSEISDLDLSSRMISLASRSTSPPPGPTSVAMLLTQARCETAKFKRSLATSFQSGAHIEQTQLDHLLSAAKSIQARLDHIIERIPSEGLLKDGSISSHIANASPQTHEWLYSDSIGEATVWGTWARLMIVMYRTEVAISVQKPFLERADSRRKQQKSMWNRYVIIHHISHAFSFLFGILGHHLDLYIPNSYLQSTNHRLVVSSTRADTLGLQHNPVVHHLSPESTTVSTSSGVLAIYMVLQKLPPTVSIIVYYPHISSIQSGLA